MISPERNRMSQEVLPEASVRAHDRRHFLKSVGEVALGASVFPLLNGEALGAVEEAASRLTPAGPAQEEEFWDIVRTAFVMSPEFINLENGYMSPAPSSVLDAQQAHLRAINARPSPFMRNDQPQERTRVKEELAAFAGCGADEIVITRNATEALDTVIAGMDFGRGDEAIVTDQDYGSMLEAFGQQSRRTGLILRTVSPPLHPVDDEDVVRVFASAITPRTKVILLTHMINLTGHVLPARKICDMAHARGVDVIVDAAHSFAHIRFSINELHCDYMGVSLHKWLCAPLGTGFLYVAKNKIRGIWPLFGDVSYSPEDIRKFEHLGTRPVSSEAGIVDAIRFHNAIGSRRKEERLRFLKNYWAEKVATIPGVFLNTPRDPARSCGIANFGITGKTPAEVVDALWAKHRIFVVPIDTGPVHGVRVTPHLYTSMGDLDRFVSAVAEIARG
jgi:selenocysteine lyase/cysteine desulfurase